MSATVGVALSANLLTCISSTRCCPVDVPLVTHKQDAGHARRRKYLTRLLGTSITLTLPAMILIYSL